MKKLITIFLILYATLSIACSCNWLGDFFEATKETNPDLIVKAKVISKIADDEGFNMKMDVEIIKIFKGQENSKIVTVWGDQGADCRPYISQFNIEDIYYLALHKSTDNYEVLICGEHFVKVVDDSVMSDMEVRDGLNQIGKIKESEFIKLLKNI